MDNFKKIFSSPKIIFVILGIILLVEFVYAIRFLNLPTPPPPPPAKRTTVQKTAGKISLNVLKTNVKVNELVPVSVMLDTGGYIINGVDLVVYFDPKVLEATPAGLVKGRIFDEYPLLTLDVKKGLISISGISRLGNGFTGQGQFAVINLRAKASGITSLIISFTKGSTADSNLVEAATSKDILEIVNNLELTLK